MAAVATRPFANDTPTSSRMSSPKDVKRNNLPVQNEASSSQQASPHLSSTGSRQASPPQPVQPPDSLPDSGQPAQQEADGKTAATNAQPLGPPPKPATSEAAGGDYFNQSHNSSHFNLEPNPFEREFGQPSTETPGKSLLPPVASLTSPSSLLPGGTPGWAESLRSGPLSPAMLPGPTGASDYFGQNFRGSFPTPNESSLRTGLTPGGGGSMFPAASPNTQAIFNSLQSGGATPGTLDFHRTALNAAAQAKAQNQNLQIPTTSAPTSKAESANQFTAMEQKSYQQQNHQQQQPQAQSQRQQQQQQQGDPFGQHDANDAANGLYMLAQANGARAGNQFAVPGQPSNIQTNVNHTSIQSQEPSPLSRRGTNKNSIGSIPGSEQAGDLSDSGHSGDTKPATRSRGGKRGTTTNGKTTNARRKAEETPIKPPANKKAKGNSGGAVQFDDDDDDSEPESPMIDEITGKKMTDEEKRKNFLERNRVAALKCRQRKKQWLQNLQNKVEIYSAENDALSGQVQQLREEIVNLKTLLLAHKDCPVANSQGLGGVNMHAFLEQSSQAHQNPYGLGVNGMPMGMPGGMGQGQPQMQRT